MGRLRKSTIFSIEIPTKGVVNFPEVKESFFLKRDRRRKISAQKGTKYLDIVLDRFKFWVDCKFPEHQKSFIWLNIGSYINKYYMDNPNGQIRLYGYNKKGDFKPVKKSEIGRALYSGDITSVAIGRLQGLWGLLTLSLEDFLAELGLQ